MTISGVVISFDREADGARSALRAEPSIQLGDSRTHRVPAVIDATDAEESRRLFRWVEQLAGVRQIDVVFVATDEEAELLEPEQPASEQIRGDTHAH